jgi:hypothetical protein
MRSIVAVLLFASAASAQVTPIAPFTGAEQEGFEGPQVIFTPCMTYRVFNNKGDLCTPGASGCHTTTGWSFACTIYPNGGQYFFGSAGGWAEFVFDQPATRFGGWFGTNCGIADAMFEFYDSNGVLITSVQGTIPADCGWYWLGWDFGSTPAKRITVTGLGFGGAFVDMDELQADFGPQVFNPTTYCTGKANSDGCVPAIAFTGQPDHSGATTFQISATNFLAGFSGHLFYGTTGQAAIPFKGGLMCVAQPIRRTPAQMPAGAGACGGMFDMDFNAHCATGVNPALAPGQHVFVQYWQFDPYLPAPNRATLSNALEFSL